MPGLQQHDREPGLYKAGMQPLREWPGLQADAGERQAQAGEKGSKRLRLAGDLRLAEDLP